jgi:hypothetical protein
MLSLMKRFQKKQFLQAGLLVGTALKPSLRITKSTEISRLVAAGLQLPDGCRLAIAAA